MAQMKAPGIYRVGSSWHARIGRDPETVKTFADSDYGGKTSAFREAKSWREAEKRRRENQRPSFYDLPEPAPRATGVYRGKGGWQARFGGKPEITCWFADRKYKSALVAFEAAKKWRARQKKIDGKSK